jgi:hypothetical protein
MDGEKRIQDIGIKLKHTTSQKKRELQTKR